MSNTRLNHMEVVLDPRGPRRTPHTPTTPEYTQENFDGCQFPCFLKEFKLTKRGDVEITVFVPYHFRGEAMHLGNGLGIPLSMDIRKMIFDA